MSPYLPKLQHQMSSLEITLLGAFRACILSNMRIFNEILGLKIKMCIYLTDLYVQINK